MCSLSIQLPEAYVRQMRELLGGEEAERFLASYGQPRTSGLRLNPLKLDPQDAAPLKERFGLEPVPWCPTGFYYAEETRPGKHPYHAAGLYYIQEPSAMSSAELLEPQPGDIVLDLAAAPGGKSTQIAGKLQGRGLLVANEIHPARAKALAENIERLGIANAIVTNAGPDQLEKTFPGYFDKIMLDAPCSGEGMFRKDPDAVLEWSPAHVQMCAARQLDIARSAVRMLKPGGRLAYSTCTFNEQENEGTIERLLSEFPQLKLEKTERIWPHRQRGEGHFVAVLVLEAELAPPPGPERPTRQTRLTGRPRSAAGRRAQASRPEEEAMRLFGRFAKDNLAGGADLLPPGEPLLFGDQLYWLPAGEGAVFSPALLQGLKTPRPGLHLAEVKKGLARPAHALALALPREDAALRTIRLSSDSEEVHRYLSGESLTLPVLSTGSGWTLVTVDGFPLGWGKHSEGQLKNHYPKGLRRPAPHR